MSAPSKSTKTDLNGIEAAVDPSLNPLMLLQRWGEKWGPWFLISTFLAWWVYSTDKVHRAAAEAAHSEFKTAMQEQTVAIKEMTQAQQATNLELVSIAAKIDAHLQQRQEHQ